MTVEEMIADMEANWGAGCCDRIAATLRAAEGLARAADTHLGYDNEMSATILTRALEKYDESRQGSHSRGKGGAQCE